MLQTPGLTAYIGCIGKDKFGEEMAKSSKDAGVNVGYILSHSLSVSLNGPGNRNFFFLNNIIH